jgi:hypothetical protein
MFRSSHSDEQWDRQVIIIGAMLSELNAVRHLNTATRR